MFGSNNNQDQPTQPANDNPAPASPPAAAAAPVPTPADSGLTSFTMDPPHPDATAPALPAEPTGSPTTDVSSAPHLDEATLPPPPVTPEDDSATDSPAVLPPTQTAPDITSDSTAPASDSGTSDDLMNIKQQALSQLSPLVNHLDQTPEDKFKTIMMMIQANDNQGLIKEAYEAAQQIPDEKAKSQALLDVVNEINYFTHNKEEQG